MCGGPGPGDGVAARLEPEDGAPQLHGLAQGGAHVPLLPAVEDGREVATGLLDLHLPVSDCSKIVQSSISHYRLGGN